MTHTLFGHTHQEYLKQNTHTLTETHYQSWASIDNLKSDGNNETLNYYQTQNGVTSLQKREFSIFVDDDLAQETQN